MISIENPILPGFNPDPSIVRVGDDYFIATSTFEWFPGVQIHHSRDLKNWDLVARPLNRVSQLDMKGIPDSCGVWAPCLSYSDGLFYLVFSNVKSFDGVWKDTPNYLVTARNVRGKWSEPIYLSSSGFDGSLFHDIDGRKWFTSMLVDHRKGALFGGITLQEYDPETNGLVGKRHYLTSGTELGKTEGPHLYKKDGYYYLLLAEGGTEYGHAVTMMRSRKITGPYEEHPSNPLVSSLDNKHLDLQKAGHGSLVETQDGDWYISFLVGRPISIRGRCILGRETALEEVIWKDGWPWLKHGTHQPRVEIPMSSLPQHTFPAQPQRVTFDTPLLDKHFQSLRIPITEQWASLTARPGHLRLTGKESLTSLHSQSLIARRVQAHAVEASTRIEFHPEHPQHLAGLVFYYNTGHYHYLNISATDDGSRKLISVMSADNFQIKEQPEVVDVTGVTAITLRGELDKAQLRFSYSIDGHIFYPIGGLLDASILSDDYVMHGNERYRAAFTGCFVGMCCQDLAMNRKHADFEWFDYKEI